VSERAEAGVDVDGQHGSGGAQPMSPSRSASLPAKSACASASSWAASAAADEGEFSDWTRWASNTIRSERAVTLRAAPAM